MYVENNESLENVKIKNSLSNCLLSILLNDYKDKFESLILKSPLRLCHN
jgi:hypothetical protein